MNKVLKSAVSCTLAGIMALSSLSLSSFAEENKEMLSLPEAVRESKALPLTEMAEYEEEKSGDYSSGDFDYNILSDGTVEIFKYYGTASTLAIPSKLGGKTVTSIGDSAFDSCTSITSVTIPNTVTSIGVGAFNGCTSITSVTIPNTVTSIEANAFNDCTSLKSISIPDSVTSLGGCSFANCTSLTSVVLSENISSIHYQTFLNCTSLKSITIPASVTYIDNSAFDLSRSLTSINVDSDNTAYVSSDGILFDSGMTKLVSYPAGKTDKTYTIPDGVTSIGTFNGCPYLTSVEFPDSIESLSGFSNCTGLTSVTIPTSVYYVSMGAFSSCTSLTSIEVDEDNFSYISQDGVLFNSAMTQIIAYPAGNSAASYTIPDSVELIEYYAFQGSSNLKSITIPDSVYDIGMFAFEDCTGLTSITIPDSVKTLGGLAFTDCTSLEKVTLSSSLEEISSGLFLGCKSLTSVTIPEGIKTIAATAFCSCSKLESLTLPDSVTTIETSAFLTSGLKTINIPKNVTSIASDAFSYNYSLESINVDSANTAYTSVDGVLFTKDKKTLVTYPMGNTATSYTVPGGVTAIGDYAFNCCGNLTSVALPYGITSIGYYAFYSSYMLKGLNIPSSVTEIGSYAFAHTAILEAIIPDGVTTIEEGTFRSIGNLKSVVIPKSVVSVGKRAFMDCLYLGSVYYAGSQADWNKISILNHNSELTGATIIYNSTGAGIPVTAKPVITSAAAGDGKVTLKWNAVNSATKYRVFYYLNGKYTAAGDTTATSYTVSNLTNGTKYGFLVRAYGNGLWSPYTTADNVYATPVAPAVVKPVVTAYAGNAKVRLNWTKVNGATKYAVYTYSGGKYTLYKNTTLNYYNVTGLTNGTKMGFLVRAYVNGKWSSFTTADIVYATPVAKPAVTAYAGNGKVRLNWGKVSGATKYAIYTYAGGKYTLYKATTANAYNVTGLTNGTAYTFLVRAYVNGKWTAYNVYDRVSATPVDKPVITKTVAADGRVRLYWNKVAGATKYAIYTYSGGKYTLYRNTTANAYTVSGLKNGTAYGFLVRAYVNGKWTTYNVYDRVSATPKA